MNEFIADLNNFFDVYLWLVIITLIFVIGIIIFTLFVFGGKQRVFQNILKAIRSIFMIFATLISYLVQMISNILDVLVNFVGTLKRMFIGDISLALTTRALSSGIMFLSAVSFVTTASGMSQLFDTALGYMASLGVQLCVLGLTLHLFVFSKHKRFKWYNEKKKAEAELDRLEGQKNLLERDLSRVELRIDDTQKIIDNEKLYVISTQQITQQIKSELSSLKEQEKIIIDGIHKWDKRAQFYSDYISAYNADVNKFQMRIKDYNDKMQKCINNQNNELESLNREKERIKDFEARKTLIENKYENIRKEIGDERKEYNDKLKKFRERENRYEYSEAKKDELNKKLKALQQDIIKKQSEFKEEQDKYLKFKNAEFDKEKHIERKRHLVTELNLVEENIVLAYERIDLKTDELKDAIKEGKASLPDKTTEKYKKKKITEYQNEEKPYYNRRYGIIKWLSRGFLALSISVSSFFSFVFAYDVMYIDGGKKNFINDTLYESKYQVEYVREDFVNKTNQLSAEYKLRLRPFYNEWRSFLDDWNSGYNANQNSNNQINARIASKQRQIDSARDRIVREQNQLASAVTEEQRIAAYESLAEINDALSDYEADLAALEAEQVAFPSTYDGINGTSNVANSVKLSPEENREMNNAFMVFSGVMSGVDEIPIEEIDSEGNIITVTLSVSTANRSDLMVTFDKLFSYTERFFNIGIQPSIFSTSQPYLSNLQTNFNSLLDANIWMNENTEIPSSSDNKTTQEQINSNLIVLQEFINTLPRYTSALPTSDADTTKSSEIPDYFDYNKRLLNTEKIASGKVNNIELALWTLTRGHNNILIFALLLLSFVCDIVSIIICWRRGADLSPSLSFERKKRLGTVIFNPYNGIGHKTFNIGLRIFQWIVIVIGGCILLRYL